MVCFLFYGIFQERLMTTSFGDSLMGQFASEFLVANNRIVAIIVSLICLLRTKQPLAPEANVANYFTIAFANTIGAFCQYESLKYVSFPSQTFAKSAKMFPVLIIGTVLRTKAYGLRDWAFSLGIMLGCSVFVLSGAETNDETDPPNTMYGVMLLLVFLFTDGFTSTLQERLFVSNQSTTYNQMLYNNTASLIICLCALFSKGALWSSIAYCIENPSFFLLACLLSLSAAIGQVFIYYTIQELGALFYSLCMVTRQLVSIILSCIIFIHPLNFNQLASAFFVFFLVYWSSYQRSESPPALPTTLPKSN